ncbi:MAG: PilZ domain-containing protein [Acidobacteria bacterium]|nr:PilZ domain-containing protein [Acidobacteriota bacterium]MCL5286474.1 PilZ domain-containing protein [Acidobacteriota bacterium]
MTPERAERRAHPRLHLVAKVEVEAQGRSFVAVVRNISAGGMQIYTAHPAAVGERLQLVFGLPDTDQVFRATGVVRNVLPNSAMGVQFEHLSDADAAAIRAFVNKTHPPDK